MAEYIFRLSGYDDPALEGETIQLLTQRLEARSRETVPGMWAVTGKLNAYAAKGPGREKRRTRNRVYGVILIALGIFVLIPGLSEPRTPVLIGTGIFAILSGILEFCLVRGKKPAAPPSSCREEAARLLTTRREADWATLRAEVCFDESGWTAVTAKDESRTDYDKLRGVFETERLWLLVYEKDMALLLQKKDLTAGDAAEFLPYLREKITK